MYPCLVETAAGVVLQLRVQPRSSRNQIVGLQSDALKLKLTSPPVDGAANRACCVYLAKLFGVTKNSVELIAGDKARQKKVLLRGLDLKTVSTVLKAHLDSAS